MTRRPHPQLILDLDAPPRYGREDYLVSPCNEGALRAIEHWPDWPDQVMVLCGPPGAGKSHLAAIWAQRSGAAIQSASAIDEGAISRLQSAGALVIEDADRCLVDEAALFHLVNAARIIARPVLLTARLAPAHWPLSIADLLSRLRLAPMVTIGDPDEGLMRAVLVKLLADRQLTVDVGLVEFAARHLGRSLADARGFVELADRQSWSAGRRLTRQLAADVLADLLHDGD